MTTEDEARILYELGKRNLSAGKYTAAANDLRQAVILTPDHGPTRFALAQSLAGAGEWRETLDELNLVLSSTPKHPGAISLKFTSLVELGLLEEAAAWTESSPAILASTKIRVTLAAVLGQLATGEVR